MLGELVFGGLVSGGLGRVTHSAVAARYPDSSGPARSSCAGRGLKFP